MAMRPDTIEKGGVVYTFNQCVQPHSCEERAGPVVVHTLYDESGTAVKCTVTHHDSILDKETGRHGGRWAIYSTTNHKTEYDPPAFDPVHGL